MVHVAVIGAGPSGLTAIKCCLDEGMDVTCFEGSDHIGGLWYFTENEEHSSICKSTVINTSKEMMSFSDFPVPGDFPVYMHNTRVLEYLNLYADHFNAKKYIKFNTKVLNVTPLSDDKDTKYEVSYEKYGKEITGRQKEIFDAVLVCTGHHWKYTIPTFEGQENFKGVQIHSKAYKDFQQFKDKVVVVVGIGNSGGDIAVELSRHCKMVYLSTRKGAWVLPRASVHGPSDQLVNRRVIQCISFSLVRFLSEAKVNSLWDLDLLGLKPKTPLFSHHPMVNDLLPWKILNKDIQVKPNIKCMGMTTVTFDDDSVAEDVDAVIYCTGYDISFPCLPSDLVECHDNKVNLYKYVFPPNRNSIAVVGCVQPVGAIMPLSELQCRWATRVFKGLATLPTEQERIADIKEKEVEMAKRYYTSKRHTIQVNYVPYADEIAKEIGCLPSIPRIFLRDPRLGLYCFFGPVYPYQYRVEGPGAWAGARDALFAGEDNVIQGTMTRKVEKKEEFGPSFRTIFLMAALLLLVAVFVAPFLRS